MALIALPPPSPPSRPSAAPPASRLAMHRRSAGTRFCVCVGVWVCGCGWVWVGRSAAACVGARRPDGEGRHLPSRRHRLAPPPPCPARPGPVARPSPPHARACGCGTAGRLQALHGSGEICPRGATFAGSCSEHRAGNEGFRRSRPKARAPTSEMTSEMTRPWVNSVARALPMDGSRCFTDIASRHATYSCPWQLH